MLTNEIRMQTKTTQFHWKWDSVKRYAGKSVHCGHSLGKKRKEKKKQQQQNSHLVSWLFGHSICQITKSLSLAFFDRV